VPPLFSPAKTTSWDTIMEVLGWMIDTKAMTVAVPHEKIVRLRKMLELWPADRRTASVKEVQSLVGKLLHLCEVVRPGKFFLRRILNYLGLPPLKSMTVRGDVENQSRQRRKMITLGPEFHDDLAFWRLILDMNTGMDGESGGELISRRTSKRACGHMYGTGTICLSMFSSCSVW